MSTSTSPADLARVWIERWNEGTPESIPMTEGFAHTSPMGRVVGRREFLELVKPMAARNVSKLEIVRILAGETEAAVHFVMETMAGPVPVCDWIVVEDGLISAVHAFYDTGASGASGD